MYNIKSIGRCNSLTEIFTFKAPFVFQYPQTLSTTHKYSYVAFSIETGDKLEEKNNKDVLARFYHKLQEQL